MLELPINHVLASTLKRGSLERALEMFLNLRRDNGRLQDNSAALARYDSLSFLRQVWKASYQELIRHLG